MDDLNAIVAKSVRAPQDLQKQETDRELVRKRRAAARLEKKVIEDGRKSLIITTTHETVKTCTSLSSHQTLMDPNIMGREDASSSYVFFDPKPKTKAVSAKAQGMYMTGLAKYEKGVGVDSSSPGPGHYELPKERNEKLFGQFSASIVPTALEQQVKLAAQMPGPGQYNSASCLSLIGGQISASEIMSDVDWMIRRGHESPGPGQYLSETKVGKIRTNMTTCTHTCSHTNSLARTCSHAHSHTDSHVIALCRHACTEENFRRVIPNLRWIGKSTVPSRLIILLERLTTTSQD